MHKKSSTKRNEFDRIHLIFTLYTIHCANVRFDNNTTQGMRDTQVNITSIRKSSIASSICLLIFVRRNNDGNYDPVVRRLETQMRQDTYIAKVSQNPRKNRTGGGEGMPRRTR